LIWQQYRATSIIFLLFSFGHLLCLIGLIWLSAEYNALHKTHFAYSLGIGSGSTADEGIAILSEVIILVTLGLSYLTLLLSGFWALLLDIWKRKKQPIHLNSRFTPLSILFSSVS
jgi:hypothetical protein